MLNNILNQILFCKIIFIEELNIPIRHYNIWINQLERKDIRVCMCICVCVRARACVYIYIYIHTHTHTSAIKNN